MLRHVMMLALVLPLLAAAPVFASDPEGPLAAPAPGAAATAPAEKEPVDNPTLLAGLYQRLSATTSPEAANATATAIERLWLISGSDTIDLLVERALVSHDAGEKELALQLLDRVIDLQPDYAEARVRRAYMRLEAERFRDAEDDLIHALALDPNHFRAWEGLGSILQRLEQKELALKAFRQLLEIYPANEHAKRAAETLERDVEGQKI